MKKKLPVVVSVDEFTKLIKHTKKTSDKITFLLGFGSGLRVSEIIGLEKRDINLNERKILVRQGKGSKDRIVPLPKGFRESHLQHIPIKVGVRQLQKSFKRASEKAGLLKTKPTLHFHSLRHGFGTRCVSEGMPIHHLRTLMGHTNISTTNVYLEANPKDALKSYEELF
ncbi:hypothetical protein LCGC14_0509700 [marine sediment metagenome]|uniref:Tyr recombinase domain-containing protein n=1 Tax=marine sediment metagenome TaxID=412755 RepID=A0A0F9S6H7_9ZZZZ|nr:hypothetical protein [bacterium]